MEGEGAAAGVTELVKMIVEERKQRDKEMAAEHARREAESKKQFELLAKLVEGARWAGNLLLWRQQLGAHQNLEVKPRLD